MAKNNKIWWVIGIIVVGLILYNNNGIFTTYKPSIPNSILSNLVNNYYYPSTTRAVSECQKNNLFNIQSSFDFKQKTMPSAKECIKIENVYYISKTLQGNLKGNCMSLGEPIMIGKESVFNNLYFVKTGKGYSFCINRGTIKSPKYSIRNFIQSSSCPKGYKVVKYTKSFSNDIQDEGKYTCSGNNIVLKYCGGTFPQKVIETCELGCEQKNFNLDGKDILITKCKGEYKPNKKICSSDGKEFFKTDNKGTLSFDKCKSCINNICTPIPNECNSNGCSTKTNSEYNCLGNLRNFTNTCLYGCSGDGDGFSCKSDCNEVIKLFNITIPDNTQCLKVTDNVVKGYTNYFIYNENIILDISSENLNSAQKINIYNYAQDGLNNFRNLLSNLEKVKLDASFLFDKYKDKLYMHYQPNLPFLGGSCVIMGQNVFLGNLGCMDHENEHYLTEFVPGVDVSPCYTLYNDIPDMWRGIHTSWDLNHDMQDRIGEDLLGDKTFPICDIPRSGTNNISNCQEVYAYTHTSNNQRKMTLCVLQKIKNNPLIIIETYKCGEEYVCDTGICQACYYGQELDFSNLVKYAWDCGARTDKDAELHTVCPSYG